METLSPRNEAIKAHWIAIIGEENFPKLSFDKDGYSTWSCRKLFPREKDDLMQSKLRKSNTILKQDELLYRPKTIVGIENNRGWITIDGDDTMPVLEFMNANNLDTDYCWSIRYDGFKSIIKISELNSNHYTHWKSIEVAGDKLY